MARPLGDYFYLHCLSVLALEGSYLLFAMLVAIGRPAFARSTDQHDVSPLPSTGIRRRRLAGLLPIELPGDKGLSSLP